MRWFNDLKIRTKLLAVFGFVSINAAVIGIVGTLSIKAIGEADTRLDKEMTVPLGELNTMAVSFQQIRVAYRDVILARNEAEQEKYAEALKVAEQDLQKESAQFEQTITTPELKDAFKTFVSTHAAFIPIENQVVELAMANRHKEAMNLLRDKGAIASATAQQASMDKLVVMKIDEAKRLSEDNAATANRASLVMILTFAFGVVIAIALGLFIAGLTASHINYLVDKASHVAEGDLTISVEQQSKDEIGQLAASFKQMVENLRRTIGRVGEASSAVASASIEISSSTEQMAAGAQEQTSQADRKSVV